MAVEDSTLDLTYIGENVVDDKWNERYHVNADIAHPLCELGLAANCKISKRPLGRIGLLLTT